MQTPVKLLDDIRWLPAVNVGDVDIPGFGLVRVSGLDTDSISLQVQAPNAHSDNCLYFNGATVIKAGSRGAVTKDFPNWVLYHVADGAPVNGQIWGSVPGEFELRRNENGFVIQGGPIVDSGIVKAGCACL